MWILSSDGEGFTYRLNSGAEGSVHVDAVLEYNEDPAYMAELMLYRLSQEAKERFEESVPLSSAGVGTSQHFTDPALSTSGPHELCEVLAPADFASICAWL